MLLPVIGPMAEDEAAAAASTAAFTAAARTSWSSFSFSGDNGDGFLPALFRRLLLRGFFARMRECRGGARRNAAGMVSSDTKSL